MNSALNVMDFVLKSMNFVLKMIDFGRAQSFGLYLSHDDAGRYCELQWK